MSFISAVQDRDDPSRLVVRARNTAHLKRLFPNHEIIEAPDADYATRVFVPRQEFMAVVMLRIEEIAYDNFKASVTDERLHDLYLSFWELHRRYQIEAGTPDRSGHLAWGEGDLVAVPSRKEP